MKTQKINGPVIDISKFLRAGKNINTKGLQRKEMMAIAKADSIPIDSALDAELIGARRSVSRDIKGCLLQLKVNDTEFLFPLCGSIRSVLAPGLTNDDETEIMKSIGQYRGKRLVLIRRQNLPAKENENEGFNFEVHVGA